MKKELVTLKDLIMQKLLKKHYISTTLMRLRTLNTLYLNLLILVVGILLKVQMTGKSTTPNLHLQMWQDTQLLITSSLKTRLIQVSSFQKQLSILVLDVPVFQVQHLCLSIDVSLQQQLNLKEETSRKDFLSSKHYSIHLNLVTQDACSNLMHLNLTL